MYKLRIFDCLKSLVTPCEGIHTALDFGSGDGWFTQRLMSDNIIKNIQPVDVKKRSRNFVEPLVYGGSQLPFKDRYFDLVYAIDVLHHCPSPQYALRDLLRCSGKFCLIKDHVFHTRIEKLILCLLDEIGNRRFGIPSPHKYQKEWEWFDILEENGFELKNLIHPAPCHDGWLGKYTNHLQFIGLWQRKNVTV